jgi:hypothetical protein
VCILEGTDSRVSGIVCYPPHMVRYHNLQSMDCILKELYCICEAVLDVLDLNCDLYMGLKFPRKAVVLFVLESDGACTSLNGHCARNSAVLILI